MYSIISILQTRHFHAAVKDVAMLYLDNDNNDNNNDNNYTIDNDNNDTNDNIDNNDNDNKTNVMFCS